MNAAGYLRELRLEAGLTQRQLAALAGVHLNSVSAFERGKLCPTVGMLDRLAAPLGYELELVKK